MGHSASCYMNNMQIGYLCNDHVKHFTLFGNRTTYYASARAALTYIIIWVWKF